MTKRRRPEPAQVDQDCAALDLRAQGQSYRAIAATLDVSVSTAHTMVGRALALVPVDSADLVRQVEDDHLDQLRAALMPKALDGDEKAAATLVRIAARRARLLGLDLGDAELHDPVVNVVISPDLFPPATLSSVDDEEGL